MSTTTTEAAAAANQFMLRGVIPHPYVPSSGLLLVELDITGLFTDRGADYIAWKQTLEDRLNELDRKYAKSEGRLRGRGVDAKYRTTITVTTQGKRRKVTKTRGRYLTMMPYPSVYASILSTIRRDFYNLFGEHGGIRLYEEWHGRRKFVTYFLLEDQAAALTKDVEGLNLRLEELNRQVAEFEKTRDFEKLLLFLEDSVPPERWSKHPVHSVIHPIALNFAPMPISKHLVETYMDSSVREQVRNNVRESVEKIVSSFNERLGEWMQNLAPLLLERIDESSLQKFEATLKEIRAESARYQLEPLVGRQFQVCEALVAAVRTGNPDTIEDAAGKVAELFSISKGGAVETIREASTKMRDVDPTVKALISTMI